MVGDNKMNSKEILEKIKILSNEEKIKINYENLKEIMEYMTPDEIIELSNIIGYPVFTRLCMGVLQHKFVLLQDGAAAIIINNEGKILLQSRADRDLWGLPGGCQELGESFKDTIIREIKEELDADILVGDLIDVVEYDYPNFHLSMNCYWCELKSEHVELKEHEDAKWLVREELATVDWLPADITLIKKIEQSNI